VALIVFFSRLICLTESAVYVLQNNILYVLSPDEKNKIGGKRCILSPSVQRKKQWPSLLGRYLEIFFVIIQSIVRWPVSP
jgi:hypothetical protein